jgi:hypothetical protein
MHEYFSCLFPLFDPPNQMKHQKYDPWPDHLLSSALTTASDQLPAPCHLFSCRNYAHLCVPIAAMIRLRRIRYHTIRYNMQCMYLPYYATADDIHSLTVCAVISIRSRPCSVTGKDVKAVLVHDATQHSGTQHLQGDLGSAQTGYGRSRRQLLQGGLVKVCPYFIIATIFLP